MSKSVKAPKGRSTKPAKPTFEDQLRAFSANTRKAYMDRFAELYDEHGGGNLIVFPVNDQEKTAIELAAQYDGQQSVHLWAKAMTLDMVRCSVESLAGRLRTGQVKIVEGKAKP